MFRRIVSSGRTLFGLRALLNACLVGVAAAAAGAWPVETAATAVLAGVSTATMALLAFDVGPVGFRVSVVELLTGILAIPAAGYAVVAGNPPPALVVAFAVVAIAAAVLMLYTVPVYGDAFVAP